MKNRLGFEYQAKEFGYDSIGFGAYGESRLGGQYDDHGIRE